jgi:DNA (cytosine-5)-methyltransferase 1
MRTGIDLFSGAGGLSLGAEFAGLKVPLAIEIDPSAASTYKRNHRAKVICDDIHNVLSNDISSKIGTPFVVFGGCPCQGFSTSNTHSRNIDNPNVVLFKEFVRVVHDLQPEWFVFENVEGITSFDKGNMLNIIISSFEDIGYTTNHDVLYASDYGVPQRRNRFFLVGNKNGIKFQFPRKHNDIITVKDAIEDLPVLVNGQKEDSMPYIKNEDLSDYAQLMRRKSGESKQNYVSKNEDYVLERYHYINPGENWQAIPEELMRNYKNSNNCHSGIYKRLDPNKPSVVISNYRKNMLIHPWQDRGLSVREAARLQSFPDDFMFEGSLMHIQQQIGNAVPPLLAKSVFKKILRYGRTL